MSSSHNEERRSALQDHPAILDAISRVIARYNVDPEHGVSKAEYITKYLCIVNLLMPQMTETEAQAEAEVDWEADSDGDSLMSAQALRKALFQLTDLWCGP